MRRSAIALTAVALAVVGFVLPGRGSAHRVASVAGTGCSAGYVRANLSWGVKCLRAGEFCKIGNAQYHRYGYTCPATGHLTRYAVAPAKTTAAVVHTVSHAITSTTTPLLTTASSTTTIATSCPSGSYVNVDGACIPGPSTSPSLPVPGGPTATCKDGTYSYSQHRSGTCSGHGGVATWL